MYVVFAVIATGEANVACCQPPALSPENLTVPSFAPAVVHRCPTWVPVFPEPL